MCKITVSALTLWSAKMSRRFTAAEDAFLKDNIGKCYTIYDLVDMFNGRFPEHTTNYRNLQKRLQKLGLKKSTHNIRPGAMPSRNSVGTVIRGSAGQHGSRVKTENGYISANKYFKEKLFGYTGNDKVIVHLNGDAADFSREHIELVSRPVYHSMCWRSWFFKDTELTRTAILTAELLLFFPDIIHNENQYCKIKRIGE